MKGKGLSAIAVKGMDILDGPRAPFQANGPGWE